MSEEQQIMSEKELMRMLEAQMLLRSLTPTQRMIAEMPIEELETEWNLIQTKTSIRPRLQRDLIASRWEYEQTQTKETEV